jgi:hypothetical protein
LVERQGLTRTIVLLGLPRHSCGVSDLLWITVCFQEVFVNTSSLRAFLARHAVWTREIQIVLKHCSAPNPADVRDVLTPVFQRVTMCTLAADQTSTWLMVDSWEAFQSYQRTAVVLDHFDHEINTVLGGVPSEDGTGHRNVRVILLAGSDLISTMSEPGVWSHADVRFPFGPPSRDPC